MELRTRLSSSPGALNEVQRRVAYRMIAQRARRFPEAFKSYPANGILEYAYELRRTYPEFYPVVAWYARNVAAGFTLKQLRDSGWEYKNRALTKRRIAQQRRFD